MGVRDYSAAAGRFSQVDPMFGGNANAYDFPENPLTEFDLSGNWKMTWGWTSGTLYLNKSETVKVSHGAVAIVLGAVGVFKGGPWIAFVLLDAAEIVYVAANAVSAHHCEELKWPLFYPGMLPRTYSGGYCH